MVRHSAATTEQEKSMTLPLWKRWVSEGIHQITEVAQVELQLRLQTWWFSRTRGQGVADLWTQGHMVFVIILSHTNDQLRQHAGRGQVMELLHVNFDRGHLQFFFFFLLINLDTHNPFAYKLYSVLRLCVGIANGYSIFSITSTSFICRKMRWSW